MQEMQYFRHYHVQAVAGMLEKNIMGGSLPNINRKFYKEPRLEWGVPPDMGMKEELGHYAERVR